MPDLPTYCLVKEAYLDGELNLVDATVLLADLDLAPDEQREWQLITAVEESLCQVAQANAAIPWIGLRVENELRQRERAKQWLDEHPRGLLGAAGLGTNSAEVRKWLIQGVVVAGGAACAAISCWLVLPFVSDNLSQFNPVLLAAGTGGLIALATLRWPELRSYYTG